NPAADPANIVESLVYILADVFDATKDLYRSLTIKEQKEYEQNLRAKGYPPSRRVEYVREESLGSEDAIMTDKSTVIRQFEKGYHAMGSEFARGDVIAHTELQSHIITLQSLLVTTAIYGPTSNNSFAHQLSEINAASRAAAAAAIDTLAALQERQMEERPVTPRSMHSATARSSIHHAPSGLPSHTPSASHAPSYAPSHYSSYAPSITPSQSASRTPTRAASHVSSQAPSRVLVLPQPPIGASAAPSKYDEAQPRPFSMRGSSPVHTTILDWRSKVEPESAMTESSLTGPVSSSALTSSPDHLYCAYAYDLQRDPTLPLPSSILLAKDPRCPHCTSKLHLSPGKAWEISKWAGDTERTFQVQNRFVVKCHRDGPDCQYCCVICSKYSDSDTICGDVKALVKHLSDEHEVRELKHEEDIMEVIEQPASRRDSGIGQATSRKSRTRRSASVVSGHGRRRRSVAGGYDREIDVSEARSLRR
ncbi:uncharacterized protein SETTUDRAFT_98284, partial [Exserohilum turcica Et28A]